MDLSSFNNNALLVAHALFNELTWARHESVVSLYDNIKSELGAEIISRKLHSITIYDVINPDEVCTIDLSSFSNQELCLLNIMVREVEDFSCLGRNIRNYLNALWHQSQKEVEARKINVPILLEELEFDGDKIVNTAKY
jgi:hypothetical protein